MSAEDMPESYPEYVTPAGAGCWRLMVWVQPGAKKSAVVGTYQGRLKLKIQAPPVDGKANKAVEQFVAKLLGLRPTQVHLESGHASRSKTLLIQTDGIPAWHQVVPC